MQGRAGFKGVWGSGQGPLQYMAKLPLTRVCMTLPLSPQNREQCQSNPEKSQEEVSKDMVTLFKCTKDLQIWEKKPKPFFRVH